MEQVVERIIQSLALGLTVCLRIELTEHPDVMPDVV